MPPPCQRCAAARLINLDTAQRIGTVSSSLVGGVMGALRATYEVTHPLLIVTPRFPLSYISAALMGAISGSQAGSRMALRFFTLWLPPGDGVPWLCVLCGHTFRQASRT